jgi:hypothetical protein
LNNSNNVFIIQQIVKLIYLDNLKSHRSIEYNLLLVYYKNIIYHFGKGLLELYEKRDSDFRKNITNLRMYYDFILTIFRSNDMRYEKYEIFEKIWEYDKNELHEIIGNLDKGKIISNEEKSTYNGNLKFFNDDIGDII